MRFVNKAGLMIRDKDYEEIVRNVDVNTYVNSWKILDLDKTPLDADKVPLARAVKYGEKNTREFIVRRDNNEDRHVWANAAPIFDKRGRQIAAIVVFLDEAGNKGLHFGLANMLSGDDSLIETDQSKMESILTNLIKNAIKFTDKGSIEISCDKVENKLLFYVKDSGIGISKAEHKSIFNRFMQAEDAGARSVGGSGLGLAITRAYVEMLGGEMWLDSEEGKAIEAGCNEYITKPINEDIVVKLLEKYTS